MFCDWVQGETDLVSAADRERRCLTPTARSQATFAARLHVVKTRAGCTLAQIRPGQTAPTGTGLGAPFARKQRGRTQSVGHDPRTTLICSTVLASLTACLAGHRSRPIFTNTWPVLAEKGRIWALANPFVSNNSPKGTSRMLVLVVRAERRLPLCSSSLSCLRLACQVDFQICRACRRHSS